MTARGALKNKDVGNELCRIYLRYLYIKHEIGVDYRTYVQNNMDRELYKELEGYISKPVEYIELERLIKEKKEVRECIDGSGNLTISGGKKAWSMAEGGIGTYINSCTNIGDRLFVHWLVLNYTQQTLDIKTYRRFIHLHANRLGLPELLMLYPDKKDNSLFTKTVGDVRSRYTRGSNQTVFGYINKDSGKNVYTLTDSGKAHAEEIVYLMDDELKHIYQTFK